MILTATQFEFRLIDGEAPSGELEADQLIAIVQSLKELAVKIGRAETEAEALGRLPARSQRVANLIIGLAPGSTKLLVRRKADDSALDFELPDERSFDATFQSIVESIARDERPAWVTDTLAASAGKLRTALEDAAPRVEFRSDGEVRQDFATKETRSETWRAAEFPAGPETISFVGRLRVVNLDTHRLQVTDDVGNKIALPNVGNDSEIARLIGSYVEVVGAPERDARGKLVNMHDAVIQPAEPLPAHASIGPRPSVALDDILASAPGPAIGGIPGLTEAEAEAFVKAIGS